MAVSPYLSGLGALSGVTQNTVAIQNQDGTPTVAGFDRNGALLVNGVRSLYGAHSHRGGVFLAGTSSAAIAIPVNTTTSGSTFAINNPAGSGKVAELIRFKLDFLHTNAAPATANVIGFSIVNTGTNATSSITKIADPVIAGGHPANLTGAAPAASVCSAITFASALTVAANWGIPMLSFPASWVPTVGGYPVPLIYDFNGNVLVPPGWCLTLTASTAWAGNTTIPSLSWAEYNL